MSFLVLLSFMVCDFLQRRGAVKGDRKNDACETLVLCSEGVVILERSGMKVARSDLKTHTHLSMLFQNRSETSDFHTAEVLSPAVISPEPEVLLARDAGPNDPKRCEAVKSFFFTHQEIYFHEGVRVCSGEENCLIGMSRRIGNYFRELKNEAA